MLALGGKKSGYDLKKALAATTSQFWSESYGNIYPALGKLLAEGLIQRDDDGALKTGRQRQLYSITEAGRLALGDWLRRPVVEHSTDNEFLLKLFFGTMMQVEDALALVEAHREHHLRLEAQFGEISQLISHGTSGRQQKVCLQATLAYGQAVSRALTEWANATTKALHSLER